MEEIKGEGKAESKEEEAKEEEEVKRRCEVYLYEEYGTKEERKAGEGGERVAVFAKEESDLQVCVSVRLGMGVLVKDGRVLRLRVGRVV